MIQCWYNLIPISMFNKIGLNFPNRAANISFKKLVFFAVIFLITHQLFAQPSITAFTPASGPVGLTVKISGKGFSNTASDNIVYFGAVKAKVSSASTTALTVTVPAGATYQPVSVTTKNLTSYSNRPFTCYLFRRRFNNPEIFFSKGRISKWKLSYSNFYRWFRSRWEMWSCYRQL